METKQVRIIIVDDHQMFIDGVKSILKNEPNIHFVAEANSGEDAWQIIQQQPGLDLLITDIFMPGMTGTELTRLVKENFPDIKVLVLSMYNDREIINQIIATDAEGYILKNTGKAELLDAIDKLTTGSTYYSDEIIDIMMDTTTQAVKPVEKDILSKRELEILNLVCAEYSTVQIASELYISPRTVDTHRKNILRKTGAKTIVGLIRFAIENQLVSFT